MINIQIWKLYDVHEINKHLVAGLLSRYPLKTCVKCWDKQLLHVKPKPFSSLATVLQVLLPVDADGPAAVMQSAQERPQKKCSGSARRYHESSEELLLVRNQEAIFASNQPGVGVAENVD